MGDPATDCLSAVLAYINKKKNVVGSGTRVFGVLAHPQAPWLRKLNHGEQKNISVVCITSIRRGEDWSLPSRHEGAYKNNSAHDWTDAGQVSRISRDDNGIAP